MEKSSSKTGSKPKFKDISVTSEWPCSKYDVLVDGASIGVVGQEMITEVVEKTRGGQMVSASFSSKKSWYAKGLDGKKITRKNRKEAVKFLEEKK